MARSRQPALRVPRPALELAEAVGYGRGSVSFQGFHDAVGGPQPTLKGHLRALARHWLILHVGYDQYAVPRRSTFGQLLVEPSAYRRSVLLYDDVLELRGEREWAFACVPIRGAFGVAIDRAIPVLRVDDRVKARAGPPYRDVVWYAYDTHERTQHSFGPPEQAAGGAREPVTVPALDPRAGLALLTATLDPRFVEASRQAASRLGISVKDVLRRARGLHPDTPPIKTVHPNTVVFPSWLEGFRETAMRQHASRVLDAGHELGGEAPGADA